MTNKLEQKEINISVDPGFDALKIVINDNLLKIPFNVEETDERKFNEMNKEEDFILLRSLKNETWRIGRYARELVFENKNTDEINKKMTAFYTEKRFIGPEFSIGVQAAIAKAIFEYSQIENVDIDIDNLMDYTINLVIALPHTARDSYASSVISALEGTHEFDLTIGTTQPIRFKFNIKNDRIIIVSQTISAIYNETSDDEGDLNEDKDYYFTDGPTLVIDGGYYTMGVVPVAAGGSIDENKTMSDTDHAMKNVNILVAQEIEDKRPDVKEYAIEHILNTQGGHLNYFEKTEDGKKTRAEIDLNKIRSNKIEEIAKDFIKTLDEKYNELMDIKYVLVTGGTGEKFFPHLKAYYVDETKAFNPEKFVLTKNEFNKKECPVEYAIAIGAYKALLAQLNDVE